MIKWLNYHHLLYFSVIAKEGSIARASERLLIGQSALSSQLKQLEESLGQKLFERKNRSLVITEAGKIALEYAEEIFKKGEEFIQVFNNKSLAYKSHYRIGVADSLPKILACKLVEEAQKVGDDCFVTLTEGTPKELLEKLNGHKIDIILSNSSSVSSSRDIFSRSAGKAKVGVYGAKKYAKYSQGFPYSISGLPLILPTKHSKLRYDIEHIFQELHIQYDLVAEVQDSSVKKLMCEHGKALILIPEFAAKPLVKSERLFKIGRVPQLVEEYWLISQKRTINNPITDELIKNFKI